MYNNCPECGSYNKPGTAFCDCGYAFDYKGFHSKDAKDHTEMLLFITLKRVCIGAMVLSVVVFACTFPFRNLLPGIASIRPELYLDPIQTEENIPPQFEVSQGNQTYQVLPRFQYELYGLVVSHHHSDSVTDVLHEKWDDFLNIKDLCVVWGSNIETGVYKEITYSSGNFTCFCKFADHEIASRFDGTALSNNHLLSDDPKLSRRILDTRNGDQIHLKGYLSKYMNHRNGFSRDTSTNRTDRGNGACETIYVTDFEIIEPANAIVRILNTLSWMIFSACVVLFFSLAFIFPKQK